VGWLRAMCAGSACRPMERVASVRRTIQSGAGQDVRQGPDGYLYCSPIRQLTASCYDLERPLPRRPLATDDRGGGPAMLERIVYSRAIEDCLAATWKQREPEQAPGAFELKEEINGEIQERPSGSATTTASEAPISSARPCRCPRAAGAAGGSGPWCRFAQEMASGAICTPRLDQPRPLAPLAAQRACSNWS